MSSFLPYKYEIERESGKWPVAVNASAGGHHVHVLSVAANAFFRQSESGASQKNWTSGRCWTLGERDHKFMTQITTTGLTQNEGSTIEPSILHAGRNLRGPRRRRQAHVRHHHERSSETSSALHGRLWRAADCCAKCARNAQDQAGHLQRDRRAEWSDDRIRHKETQINWARIEAKNRPKAPTSLMPARKKRGIPERNKQHCWGPPWRVTLGTWGVEETVNWQSLRLMKTSREKAPRNTAVTDTDREDPAQHDTTPHHQHDHATPRTRTPRQTQPTDMGDSTDTSRAGANPHGSHADSPQTQSKDCRFQAEEMRCAMERLGSRDEDQQAEVHLPSLPSHAIAERKARPSASTGLKHQRLDNHTHGSTAISCTQKVVFVGFRGGTRQRTCRTRHWRRQTGGGQKWPSSQRPQRRHTAHERSTHQSVGGPPSLLHLAQGLQASATAWGLASSAQN